MKRMAAAHEVESEKGNLKAWTASAAEFKSKQSEVIHEAEILGMMTRVLQDASYEYPEEFIQIAKDVESTTQEIVQAAKSGNHSAAQAAVGKITNACTNCHGKFKD
jgi:hypothetical protein